MNTNPGNEVVAHAQYSISNSGSAMVFTWKHVEGLNVADMASGVAEFANQCKIRQPRRAVIDARLVDQNSSALEWVSGQQIDEQKGGYNDWWLREIVPLYNAAGITGLAVATGNPQAPGELPNVPPGADFKVGYFHGFDEAANWVVG